jgi:hypothetical protein
MNLRGHQLADVAEIQQARNYKIYIIQKEEI